jgi:hypothetical protein
LAITVLLFACTFALSDFVITTDIPLILAVLAPVVTLTLARFWWLEQIKHDNGGLIRNGWKETWDLFPGYRPISVCLWPLIMAAVRLGIANLFKLGGSGD